MSIRKALVAAAATLALALPAYAAPAGAARDSGPSTFTLIAQHGMGGGRGGMAMGGRSGMGMGAPRMGGMGMGGQRFGATGFINRGGMHMGGGGFATRRFGGNGRVAGNGFRGRTAFYNGRRGYWRGGRWFPLAGLGIYAGGNCYLNCRAQGFGPGYCSANAYNFCY